MQEVCAIAREELALGSPRGLVLIDNIGEIMRHLGLQTTR